MVHKLIEQNSESWYAIRAGIPTASSFERIISAKKLQYSEGAERYISQLLSERTTGHVMNFQSAQMQRGHEMEPESRKAFTLATGLKVEDGGFFLMDDLRSGASPDGLIETLGTWEAKNTDSGEIHTHRDRYPNDFYLEHRIQIQVQLIHSEREFCWLMSYCPELPDVRIRVEREPETIAKILDARNRFCDALDEAWELHKKKHSITISKWEADREAIFNPQIEHI